MSEAFDLTTYYAKRIIGDTAAASEANALLQTGTDIAGDTWILHRDNRTSKLYGIKYAYDGTNGHDKIQYYGKTSSDNATAWIQLDTGDASFNSIFGKVEVTNTAIPSTGTAYYFPYITGNTTNTYGLLSSNRLYLYDSLNTTFFCIGATNRTGGLTIRNANGKYADFTTSAFTANRTITIPDETGTIALLTKTDINALINLLDTGSSVLTANDYIITQYVGGGTTTTTYHRRAAKNVRVGGLTTARSLWGNSFDGTADISGNFVMKNNSSRYHRFTVKQHGTDNTVGEMYYDSGNATNVTSGRWRWEEWSPNSTNNTTTTGYYEVYSLPIVNTGLTANASYNILTSKDLSFSITGNAATATALTSNAGGTEQPIYFTNGQPVATSYALKATINNSTSGYMAYYSEDRAISGTSNIRATSNGTLSIFPTGGNYRDGIRIHARSSDNTWAAIILCGSDNTEDSGTSANTWFIGAKEGNLYFGQNGTGSSGNYLRCVGGTWAWNGTASGSINGNAATASSATSATYANYPTGFNSRGTSATWGNQTGTTVTVWGESDGGAVEFRKNNPSSGKISIKVDGRLYGNEGNCPAMLMNYANSYWGMADPDGGSSVWIRTTSNGIIPYQSGSQGSGHCGLGTSSWYFSSAYIDNIYSYGLYPATINFNNKGACSIYNGPNDGGHGYNGALNNLVISSWYGVSFTTSCASQTCTGKNAFSINCRNGYAYAGRMYNAVWNDYAEFRKGDTIEPGRCMIETSSGIMTLSNKRLQPGAKIISDTYGYSMGETKDAKTPIAVSGRVLAYPYRNPIYYQLGAAVCSAPGGTVDIMSREEIMMYPERIVGTVSEIPNYEVWHAQNEDESHSTNIQVNGRIWIYVR